MMHAAIFPSLPSYFSTAHSDLRKPAQSAGYQMFNATIDRVDKIARPAVLQLGRFLGGPLNLDGDKLQIYFH